MIGTSAGYLVVLVSAHNGLIVSSIELIKGSITDIAFRNQSLGIASDDTAKYFTDDDKGDCHNIDDGVVPSEIKRPGVSIQCIDISPNGTWVAPGFWDKLSVW